MLRKLFVSTLVFVFLFSALASANAIPAEGMTSQDKLSAAETFVYGTVQTGSLMERINKIQKDMYGKTTNDPLMQKIDKMYAYAKITSLEAPAFSFQLNALEWSFNHTISSDRPAKIRLEDVEHTVSGNVVQGALDDRLHSLLKLSYSAGRVEAIGTSIPKDSLVKIKMTQALSNKTNRVGDKVVFQVNEDVYAGGVLVIAKGAVGTGKISKVEQARNFGRDAELKIDFESVEGFDGTMVPVFLGDKAKKETLSMAKAAGASVAGMIVLGPIGIVGGAFVHGKDITVPPGAEMYVQTTNDIDIYGIQSK
ncbi:MAG: hypothetical protein LLG02_15960 [Pelosinus sp.]|nr:hypothetical protein [Pelosinus sp.]